MNVMSNLKVVLSQSDAVNMEGESALTQHRVTGKSERWGLFQRTNRVTSPEYKRRPPETDAHLPR